MNTNNSLFADGFRDTPYWWDHAAPQSFTADSVPVQVDVAIVGSGYTGMNAGLETARGGRDTLVLDAERAGWGCSSRNGGQISTSIKPTIAQLAKKFGDARGRAIHHEGAEALAWIADFVRREDIDCDFRKAGRFHAAHTPHAYEVLARSADDAQSNEDIEAFVVPRAEQHSELGTDAYHGGVVYPRHSALHPSKYMAGLTMRATEAGVRIVTGCSVTGIERTESGFRLRTALGDVAARDVIVATNGYTGSITPWMRRRVIPIGSYIIATEPLPRETIDRLFPTDRVVSDSRKVVYYYRASPDRTRIVFGGRVSSNETDPRVSGPRLHAEMVRLFPELAAVRISHSWWGSVAYSFDELVHTGAHDGIHYSMAYCGSGVSMASYLGMRMGKRVLGQADGATAFDNLPFPTRPFYTGNPWFLPTAVAWYRWRDERQMRRARA